MNYTSLSVLLLSVSVFLLSLITSRNTRRIEEIRRRKSGEGSSTTKSTSARETGAGEESHQAQTATLTVPQSTGETVWNLRLALRQSSSDTPFNIIDIEITAAAAPITPTTSDQDTATSQTNGVAIIPNRHQP